MYHSTPVIRRASNGLEIGNPELLHFYANRLEGRGLEAVLTELPGGARIGGDR
jgi:hypothetical protein